MNEKRDFWNCVADGYIEIQCLNHFAFIVNKNLWKPHDLYNQYGNFRMYTEQTYHIIYKMLN